jgi:hypothetical protein
MTIDCPVDCPLMTFDCPLMTVGCPLLRRKHGGPGASANSAAERAISIRALNRCHPRPHLECERRGENGLGAWPSVPECHSVHRPSLALGIVRHSLRSERDTIQTTAWSVVLSLSCVVVTSGVVCVGIVRLVGEAMRVSDVSARVRVDSVHF